MRKPKFKVGDRVKMLPSAVDIGVFTSEIGKVGVITELNYLGLYIRVRMDKKCKGVGFEKYWAVNPDQIELVILIGQQLLFDFYKE